jgi:hypothetical protein
MALLTPDEVKALEAKHGADILVIHVTDGADVSLVFKPATAAHWRRLNAADKRVLAGDDAAAMVPELIARELLVHPSKTDFDAIRDEAPWIAENAGRALVGRVGQKFKASVGESSP